RHLRRDADEGGAGRCDDRQVERPARARRPLRPGRRDLPRQDHRRDPRRRARRAPDRRGDRRLRCRQAACRRDGGMKGMKLRAWMPLALITTLILALGAYATVRQDAFLTKYNLGNLLLTAMPLALVALGQTTALLVGGFDVSVAALMTMCVVTASFTLQPDKSWTTLLPGAFVLIGVGLATGVFNATLIRFFRLPSIIATLGTLSILEG